MKYLKEYMIEHGQIVDITKLRSEKMSKEDYLKTHKGMIIFCHDAVIRYNGGLLLVKRDTYPVKNELWLVGGRVERGVTFEESLRRKVKQESNLDLEDITLICFGRTVFNTDPFGHGKGTDTVSLVYYAEGKGKLKLDETSSDKIILSLKEYYNNYRDKLHPYVKDCIDEAIYVKKLK